MALSIRKMLKADKECIVSMMRVFYASPAVHSDGSEEIFSADVDACTGDSPYAQGFVFESDGEVAGYGMLAFGFSTEYGKRCTWIEDIYVREEFRGAGIATAFLKFVKGEFPDNLLRLEVDAENVPAIRVYERAGFRGLPYTEMFYDFAAGGMP